MFSSRCNIAPHSAAPSSPRVTAPMCDMASRSTTLQPVTAGTEGAISLEGTLASAAGSVLMTLVLLGLQLLPNLTIAGVVMLIGLVATLAESLLGALAQDRVAWLSNELVNALQTTLAAVLAMLVAVRLL